MYELYSYGTEAGVEEISLFISSICLNFRLKSVLNLKHLL